MTTTETAPPPVAQDVRDQILNNPSAVLDDADLLSALISADDGLRGENVVDLRGLAIARLEERLDRLEHTHQNVLSAAYENVATTAQVHRAIHAMIAPLELDGFLGNLGTDVADILQVASVKVLIATENTLPPNPVLLQLRHDEIERYMDTWRSARRVEIVMRNYSPERGRLHDETRGTIRSEALMRLELGESYPAAMLALGAVNADQYQPGHATDLLELFGRVCERVLRELLP